MSHRPLIIGHRGACGYRPEHTLESFQLAMEMGVDAIETDVVMSRDGVLICRHDRELSRTTNVADHPEFASRKTAKVIDGVQAEGWFVDDFTADEIRQLRARERFDFRNRSNDGQFRILTLEDLLAWTASQQSKRGFPLAVIIEIKHAAYFESMGLPVAEPVARAMEKFSLAGADARASVECFEIDILKRLRRRLDTPLIQLLDAAQLRPADVAAAGGQLTFGEMLSPAGLTNIKTYASAVGVWKRLVVPEIFDAGPQAGGLRLGDPTPLIGDAHAAGLEVHAWTFRDEPRFLLVDYAGDPLREYQQFMELGIDGVITDFPDSAIAAMAGYE